MWIFTVDGFYSAVKPTKEKDTDKLMIRARFKEDLERIMDRVHADKVIETPMCDYPYRMSVKANDWATYLVDSVQTLDYPNFKDRALRRATFDRNARYHEVWAAMAYEQKERLTFTRR